MFLKQLFSKKHRQLIKDAAEFYGRLVAHSREEVFYTEGGVPDTLDGRFEMVLLLAALVVYRMRAFGREGEDFNQAVFDVMFADMDQAQREAGIGDAGVPHHIKRMAKAFYGRLVAYQKGLESADPAVLEEALRRNMFGTVADIAPAHVTFMADYARHQHQSLSQLSFDFMKTDALVFVLPEGKPKKRRKKG